MVAPKLPERTGRIPYKTYLSLLPVEWEKLRREAERRHITGREVIEGALSRFCSALPTPAPRAAEEVPPPEDPGD